MEISQAAVELLATSLFKKYVKKTHRTTLFHVANIANDFRDRHFEQHGRYAAMRKLIKAGKLPVERQGKKLYATVDTLITWFNTPSITQYYVEQFTVFEKQKEEHRWQQYKEKRSFICKGC